MTVINPSGASGGVPSGAAGGDLTGTYPNPTVDALKITDAKVAAANKDGAAGTASMRTLGTGAAQAAAGNDSRLSDSRAPSGTAAGELAGTYPNPTLKPSAIPFERKMRLWRPSALGTIIDEVDRRDNFAATPTALTSAILRLTGGLVVPAGTTVTSIAFYGVTTGATLTHTWFVLCDTSGNILGITADDTGAAWTATAFKTLNLTTPYVASVEIAVYAGICIVGGTIPTMPMKQTSGQNLSGTALPQFGCASNTALTTPASLGAGPVTLGGAAGVIYAALL